MNYYAQNALSLYPLIPPALVIDRDLERIQFHHEFLGAYPSARNARVQRSHF